MERAPEGLPLAEEAYRIAIGHGYLALAKQIETALQALRDAVRK
jgi:hypothetical protein